MSSKQSSLAHSRSTQGLRLILPTEVQDYFDSFTKMPQELWDNVLSQLTEREVARINIEMSLVNQETYKRYMTESKEWRNVVITPSNINSVMSSLTYAYNAPWLHDLSNSGGDTLWLQNPFEQSHTRLTLTCLPTLQQEDYAAKLLKSPTMSIFEHFSTWVGKQWKPTGINKGTRLDIAIEADTLQEHFSEGSNVHNLDLFWKLLNTSTVHLDMRSIEPRLALVEWRGHWYQLYKYTLNELFRASKLQAVYTHGTDFQALSFIEAQCCVHYVNYAGLHEALDREEGDTESIVKSIAVTMGSRAKDVTIIMNSGLEVEHKQLKYHVSQHAPGMQVAESQEEAGCPFCEGSEF